jgi:hypothetical protein
MPGEKKRPQPPKSSQKPPAAKEKPKVESGSSTGSRSQPEQPRSIFGSLRRRFLGRSASVGYSVLSNFDPDTDTIQPNEERKDTDQQLLGRKESKRTKSRDPQSKEQRPLEEKKATGGPSLDGASRPLAQQKKPSNTFGFLKKLFKQQPASQSNALPFPTPVSPEKLRDAEELLKAIRGPYDSKNRQGIILGFNRKKAILSYHDDDLVSTPIARKDIKTVLKQAKEKVKQFNNQSKGKYKLTIDDEYGEENCIVIEDIPGNLLQAVLQIQPKFVPSECLCDIITPHELSVLLAVQSRPHELSVLLAMAVRAGDDVIAKKLLGKKAVIDGAVLDSLLPLPEPRFDKMLQCLYPSMSPEFLSEVVPRKIKNLLEGGAVFNQENIKRNCGMLIKRLLWKNPSNKGIAEKIASSAGYRLDLIVHSKGVRGKLTPLEEKEKKDDREVVSTSVSSSRVTASSSFSSRNQRVQTHTSSSSEESEAGHGQVDDAVHSFAPSSLL